MEGTVTISLKNYEILREILREMEEERDSYSKTAFKQIVLLEKIEEFLKLEEIETELINEISEILDKWYG